MPAQNSMAHAWRYPQNAAVRFGAWRISCQNWCIGALCPEGEHTLHRWIMRWSWNKIWGVIWLFLLSRKKDIFAIAVNFGHPFSSPANLDIRFYKVIMKTKVYIETSIPSFYFEVRKEPEMVAQKNWTRKWWDSQRSNYDMLGLFVPTLITPLELITESGENIWRIILQFPE